MTGSNKPNYDEVNIYGKGNGPTPKKFIKRTSALGKKYWGPDVIISNSLQEIQQLKGRLAKTTKKEYYMAIIKPGSKMISSCDFGELLKTAPYVNKEIEVYDLEEYPEPTKFILNAENKTLKKGKSFQLKVKEFEPKGAFDKVIYSSPNKKIATVDKKGKVVAKKPGTAVITVQCPTNKKIKATCVITVPSDKKPTPTLTKKPTAIPTAKPSETPTVEDSLTGLPTITPVNTTTPLPTATVLPEDSVEFYLEDGEFLKYTGNLKSIGFSDEVTKIDDEAFLNCINLSTVKFSTGLTSIGNYAFSGCDNLKIYCSPGSYVETYAIENSIPYENISDME